MLWVAATLQAGTRLLSAAAFCVFLVAWLPWVATLLLPPHSAAADLAARVAVACGACNASLASRAAKDSLEMPSPWAARGRGVHMDVVVAVTEPWVGCLDGWDARSAIEPLFDVVSSSMARVAHMTMSSQVVLHVSLGRSTPTRVPDVASQVHARVGDAGLRAGNGTGRVLTRRHIRELIAANPALERAGDVFGVALPVARVVLLVTAASAEQPPLVLRIGDVYDTQAVVPSWGAIVVVNADASRPVAAAIAPVLPRVASLLATSVGARWSDGGATVDTATHALWAASHVRGACHALLGSLEGRPRAVVSDAVAATVADAVAHLHTAAARASSDAAADSVWRGVADAAMQAMDDAAAVAADPTLVRPSAPLQSCACALLSLLRARMSCTGAATVHAAAAHVSSRPAAVGAARAAPCHSVRQGHRRASTQARVAAMIAVDDMQLI